MRPTRAPLPQAPLDDTQRLACLRLARSDNIGPVTFRELINHFGGAVQALEALPELARRGGGRRALRICPRQDAERELAAAARAGARPVFTIEPGYPALLAHIDAPPPILYVKGRAELLSQPAVAIVGSRNASAIGLRLTRRIARDLGEAGYVVISGLARGIDAAAHEAALATGTAAVLAGGIDIVYPPEHAGLQARIGEEGCLATEMPTGFQPRAQDFPRRNRIVSGMALGVLIVEAARRSGSLITARMAAEQGRDVLAVPGHPLDPRAEGVNHLLKTGATLVTGAEDVIAALRPLTGGGPHASRRRGLEDQVATHGGAPAPWLAANGSNGLSPIPPEGGTAGAPPFHAPSDQCHRPVPAAGNDERRQVLAALGPTPVSLDDVARESGVPIHIVQAVVLELAIAGRVERHGGQLVSLHPDEGAP